VDSTVADTALVVAPLNALATFYWRAQAVNDSGSSTWSSTISFTTGDQVNAVPASVERPAGFQLMQNYPNPFNGISDVGFRIADLADVQLHVYDLLGREMATLVNERKAPGVYTVHFDAGGLPSGVYMYRLTAGRFSETRKMILSR
jgi:hypothetical protein